MSDEFPINRGVSQGDPLSPKLLTAVMVEIFKKADISERINVDVQKKLTNLKFADGVALFNEKNQNNGTKTLKQSELKKSESWPKILKGKKTKCMKNNAESEDIVTDQEQIEKVTEFIIHRTNHTPQRHYNRRNICQDQSSVEL